MWKGGEGVEKFAALRIYKFRARLGMPFIMPNAFALLKYAENIFFHSAPNEYHRAPSKSKKMRGGGAKKNI